MFSSFPWLWRSPNFHPGIRKPAGFSFSFWALGTWLCQVSVVWCKTCCVENMALSEEQGKWMGQYFIASNNADVFQHQSHWYSNLGLQSMGLTSCRACHWRDVRIRAGVCLSTLTLNARCNVQHTVQCKYVVTYKSMLIMIVEIGQLKSTRLLEAVPDLSESQRSAIWFYYMECVDADCDCPDLTIIYLEIWPLLLEAEVIW